MTLHLLCSKQDEELDVGIISNTLKLLSIFTSVSSPRNDMGVNGMNPNQVMNGQNVMSPASHLSHSSSVAVTEDHILRLIDNANILSILYESIEVLQAERKTLHLLMELLLNMVSNCKQLSREILSWIMRIVIEFSNKYQKSTAIQQYMIRIVTCIVGQDPTSNVSLLMEQQAECAVFETLEIL